MGRPLTLTLGRCLLNCEERTDCRFLAQKGTLTVRPQISANLTKLGLQRSQATIILWSTLRIRVGPPENRKNLFFAPRKLAHRLAIPALDADYRGKGQPLICLSRQLRGIQSIQPLRYDIHISPRANVSPKFKNSDTLSTHVYTDDTRKALIKGCLAFR